MSWFLERDVYSGGKDVSTENETWRPFAHTRYSTYQDDIFFMVEVAGPKTWSPKFEMEKAVYFGT